MTILDRTYTLTFTHEEALSLRMASNETGSGWTTRGHEARAAGLDEDAETCFRIAARYSAIWDRIAAAMNAPAPARPAPDWRDRYGRPLVEDAPAPACETFAAPRGDNGGLL
jgi:hypothetical protein